MKRVSLFPAIGLILAIFIPILLFGSTRVYSLDENNCLSCHGNPGLTKTNGEGTKISLYVNEEAVNSGAHRFIDCTTCHTSEPHEVITPLTKLSLAEKCGSCHQYQYKLHLQSVHGQQLARGNQDVATCVDCHSPDYNPHSIVRVLQYDAPTYKKNIARTCANCHNNEELMANYAIVEKVYESYTRSFHGKAMQLGTYEISQLDKATCTNCHGVHDIKSVSDPTSPVAGLENLAKTCEQCHPGAGVEFASGFLGHEEASPQNIPAAHYTEIIFTTLLISVVSFGALVVFFATVRFSVNRWRE
ncbi:MAG: cytochrome c3 family protein [Dehalococcoidales bacterium]|nr:cytochrome c3 family protein [Dehalococcoidales bacterium]MDZ4246124.1 cytochrome c3 family protein [Dehalococcoidia bacterium]